MIDFFPFFFFKNPRSNSLIMAEKATVPFSLCICVNFFDSNLMKSTKLYFPWYSHMIWEFGCTWNIESITHAKCVCYIKVPLPFPNNTADVIVPTNIFGSLNPAVIVC